MKIKYQIKNFLYIYLQLVVLAFILFYLIFVKQVIPVDYVFCSELKSYSEPFRFVFPQSCDQNYYFSGFYKLSNIFMEDFNYQERPLYIVLVFLIKKVLDIFFQDSILLMYLAISLSQVFITSVCVYLLNEILIRKNIIKKNYFFTISLFIIFNPLFKWGIFDPSHQLLTLLVILVAVLLSEIKLVQFNFSKSFLFGILFLLHREFLIAFVYMLLFHEYKKNKKVTFINKYYLNFLYSYIPSLIYQFVIRVVLGLEPYDANTEYWGQFIWIAYFLLGIKKYDSEWHCVSIPENFICYITDFSKLIYYLIVPVILLMAFFIMKKNIDSNLVGFRIVVFLFIFWSFIGWYPPIRFNYYSFGLFIIINSIVVYFLINNIVTKYLYILTYIFYCFYLNHWNYENVLQINTGIKISFLFLLLYIISLKFYEKKVR